MGLEATCQVRVGRRAAAGKARLEEKELLFRGGELALRIPLAEIGSVVARSGALEVSFGGRKASFALGAAAEKWALKIRQPRGLLDKLGVKPGLRVDAVGIEDADVLRQLRERVPELSLRPRKGSDMMFAWVGSAADLARLVRLRASLNPAGAVWAIWAKGRRELGEDHIRAAALGAGLVDVKVVSVSKSLSGLKLVIPVAQRKG